MEAKESTGEIILYQADGATRLEVKLRNDTVWLTQGQMAELFEKDRTVIGRHISNIFKEHELEEKVVCAKFAHTTAHGAIFGKTQEKEITLYNLDVIISVGYRVKSKRGILFRQWANKVLKDYLLRGYAVNLRQKELEGSVNDRLAKQDSKINEISGTVSELNKRVDFLVKTSRPVKQGVFFQGQIFDAYAFFERIIQKAQTHIILIDGYVDLSILERFATKKAGVSVDIYTGARAKISELDVQKFNAQYAMLTLHRTDKMHDRFLIIDGAELYHIGASLKDLGTRCFAFEKMDDAEFLIPEILKHL